MITNIINTQIMKVTKGHFYVYFNLNLRLRSYGQLFVLVYTLDQVLIIKENHLFWGITDKGGRITYYN